MSSNSDSAGDYHAADESDGHSGRYCQFQCRGQWDIAIELPVEFWRDEHCGGDEHPADVDQRAVEPGGELCGAGDQPLWVHPQFQRGADGEFATGGTCYYWI